MKRIIAFVLIVLLAGGGVLLIKKRKEENSKIALPKIYPIVVKMASTKSGDIMTTLDYLAVSKSANSVVINSKFAGKIMYEKEVGERVKKGEVVVKIDDTELKNNLASINKNLASLKKTLYNQKAILANLKDTLYRSEKLLKVNFASIEEVKSIKNKILELKSQIETLKAKIKSLKESKKTLLNNLKYANITSPIDGIVSFQYLNIGENAFPAKPILKISGDKSYLLVNLPKKYKFIKFEGKIYPLIYLHQAKNSLLSFKVNVDKFIPEGEQVNISVITYKGNATLVPVNSILSINHKNYLFTPKAEEVNILAYGKEGVVVDKNISKVVVAPADILLKIKAGYPVKIKE